MQSKAQNQSLQKLSLSIGNFIRYWGFRRIHGAIWTQVYLSNTPLSCTELTERLGLSKALISPALEELVEFRLLKIAPAPNDKTKLYVASENINEVIQHVLKTREAKMLRQITDDFGAFQASASKNPAVDEEKVESLAKMIQSANLMLQILLSQSDLLQMPLEFDS